MNLEEFQKAYPYALPHKSNKTVVEYGLLEFDEESAHVWAGPYEEKYAFFELRDYRSLKLPTMNDLKQARRLSKYTFPREYWSYYNKDAIDEQQLQMRLRNLTPKQMKEWEENLTHIEDKTSVEYPFSLYMRGNDDTSYTKYFETLETAQQELKLLQSCQPLNFWSDLKPLGYVFTN